MRKWYLKEILDRERCNIRYLNSVVYVYVIFCHLQFIGCDRRIDCLYFDICNSRIPKIRN